MPTATKEPDKTRGKSAVIVSMADAARDLARQKAALEATGRPVAIVEAMGGKDLNDTLQGAA